MTIAQLEEGNKLQREISDIKIFIKNIKEPEAKLSLHYPNGWNLDPPEFMEAEYTELMASWHRAFIQGTEARLVELEKRFKDL